MMKYVTRRASCSTCFSVLWPVDIPPVRRNPPQAGWGISATDSCSYTLRPHLHETTESDNHDGARLLFKLRSCVADQIRREHRELNSSRTFSVRCIEEARLNHARDRQAGKMWSWSNVCTVCWQQLRSWACRDCSFKPKRVFACDQKTTWKP